MPIEKRKSGSRATRDERAPDVAYRLSQAGYTHRQIADRLGCKPEAVAGKILAGSRRAAN